MELEPVLTMKIVDNFVRFGMPYQALHAIHIRVPGEPGNEAILYFPWFHFFQTKTWNGEQTVAVSI